MDDVPREIDNLLARARGHEAAIRRALPGQLSEGKAVCNNLQITSSQGREYCWKQRTSLGPLDVLDALRWVWGSVKDV